MHQVARTNAALDTVVDFARQSGSATENSQALQE
jgi:hypothetical protein